MSPIRKEAPSAYFVSFFGSVHSLELLLGTHCHETQMKEKTSCCLCRPKSHIKCLVGNPPVKQCPSDCKCSSLGLWDLLQEVPSEACLHPWVFFLNLCLFYAVNTYISFKTGFSKKGLKSVLRFKPITSDIQSHRGFLGLKCKWNKTNSSPTAIVRKHL